jgi:hypothetical protein
LQAINLLYKQKVLRNQVRENLSWVISIFALD